MDWMPTQGSVKPSKVRRGCNEKLRTGTRVACVLVACMAGMAGMASRGARGVRIAWEWAWKWRWKWKWKWK